MTAPAAMPPVALDPAAVEAAALATCRHTDTVRSIVTAYLRAHLVVAPSIASACQAPASSVEVPDLRQRLGVLEIALHQAHDSFAWTAYLAEHHPEWRPKAETYSSCAADCLAALVKVFPEKVPRPDDPAKPRITIFCHVPAVSPDEASAGHLLTTAGGELVRPVHGRADGGERREETA